MAVLTGLFRLGSDAEIRHTANGDAVCQMALAYNYGQKKDGKQPSQWIDASLWGKRGETLAQYLTKGTSIVATLEDVHVRTFKKSDGSEGNALSGRVLTVEFAGKPAESKPAPKPAAKAADPFVDDDIDNLPF